MLGRHVRSRRTCSALVAVAACGGEPAVPDAALPNWERLSELPQAVANNAVASIDGAGGCQLLSAMGIDGSRQAAGISAQAWLFTDRWEALPDVPGLPRLAASAVTVQGKVYVLGGYSVAESGAETSHTDVAIFDPETRTWSSGATLPTAIDDAIAVSWRDRWIVVVSGWSQTTPVRAVQIFDVESGVWDVGTPFPGSPVFGHAGALVGDDLVLIDGVASGTTGFRIVSQTWRGRLDPSSPTTIEWTQLPDHPGPARYRAAAGRLDGLLMFHGGTSDPYNYDGLSYTTGTPSAPLADAIAFDPATTTWGPLLDKPIATMDHRSLVGCGARVFTVGGMEAGPTVSGAVWSFGP